MLTSVSGIGEGGDTAIAGIAAVVIAGATGAIVVLGVIATGLAFVAYGGLIGRSGGTRASGVLYAIPVVALALGVTFPGRRRPVTPLSRLTQRGFGIGRPVRREARPGQRVGLGPSKKIRRSALAAAVWAGE